MAGYTGEPDEMFDNHFNKFLLNEDNDGGWALPASFVKFGHVLQDLENMETIQIQYENFNNVNKSSLNKVHIWKKDLADRLMETMRGRFQSLENPLFELDESRSVWVDERTYGNGSLENLANHLKVTLAKASFQRQKLIPEWAHLKIYVKSHLKANSSGMKQMQGILGITFCCTLRKNFPMYISSFKFLFALQAQMLQQNMH